MTQNIMRSKAQLAALRRLHAARRGVRSRPPDPERERVLRAVREAVREPVYRVRSIRVLADELGVSDTAVRNWLIGRDWPSARHVQAMAMWVERVRA